MAGMTHGSLALAQQPANVVEFKPRLSVVPEPVKGKSKAGKSKGKTISTKEECDWLKARFPAKLPNATGTWAITNSGAGFVVVFRVDARQNQGTPINVHFPRISREMFITLKGMGSNECKTTIEKYVRGHLGKAIRCGDDRARAIAGKLRISC
jgi:hypothetical protein